MPALIDNFAANQIRILKELEGLQTPSNVIQQWPVPQAGLAMVPAPVPVQVPMPAELPMQMPVPSEVPVQPNSYPSKRHELFKKRQLLRLKKKGPIPQAALDVVPAPVPVQTMQPAVPLQIPVQDIYSNEITQLFKKPSLSEQLSTPEMRDIIYYNNNELAKAVSDVLVDLASRKEVNAPCCPDGPCCPDRLLSK